MVGRPDTISQGLMTSSALAALVAGILAVSTGSLIKGLFQPIPIQINVEALTWWSQLRVNIAPAAETGALSVPVVASPAIITISSVQSPLKTKAAPLSVKAKSQARTSVAVSARPKMKTFKRMTTHPRVVMPASDEIHLSQSSTLSVESASTVESLDSSPQAREAKSLLSIHQLLSRRFLVAMDEVTTLDRSVVASVNGQPERSPSTQNSTPPGDRNSGVRSAAAVVVVEAANAEDKKSKAVDVAVVKEGVYQAEEADGAEASKDSSEPEEVKATVLTANEPIRSDVPAKEVLPAAIQVTPSTQDVLHKVSASPVRETQPEVKTQVTQSDNQKFRLSPDFKNWVAAEFASAEQTLEAHEAVLPFSQDPDFQVQDDRTGLLADEGSTSSPFDMWLSPSQLSRVAMSVRVDYSIPGVIYQGPWSLNLDGPTQALSSQGGARYAGQSQPATSRYAFKDNDDGLDKPDSQKPIDDKGRPDLMVDEKIAAAGIEVLNSDSALFAAEASMLTTEGPRSGGQARWLVVQAGGHWKTVVWQRPEFKNPFQKPVPMVSKSTLNDIERVGGVEIRETMGLIVGKVPAEWTVKFSGRAEAPIYLDNLKNRVTSDDLYQDRYFVFPNAEPGTHLITLLEPGTGLTVGIAVIVMDHAMTYLDLPKPRFQDMTGQVLDASSTESKGLAGIEVGVVGQKEPGAITTATGHFQILNVLSLGDYPLDVDTDAAHSFKHRYRVSPSGLTDVKLFRFEDSKVNGWISELEGGVSSESGLVVAAVQKNTESEEGLLDGLYPLLRPLMSNPTLIPETYSLSETDRLWVGRALNADSPRFVGVQIPPGGNIAEIENRDRTRVNSQLIVSQPGVVNIVLFEVP